MGERRPLVGGLEEELAGRDDLPAGRQRRDGDGLVLVQPQPPRHGTLVVRPVEHAGGRERVEAAVGESLDVVRCGLDGPVDLRVAAGGLLEVEGGLDVLARAVADARDHGTHLTAHASSMTAPGNAAGSYGSPHDHQALPSASTACGPSGSSSPRISPWDGY